MINPGTVAAIAASLMAQGENLGELGEIFTPHWRGARDRRISQFVALAWDIARETEEQHPNRQPEKMGASGACQPKG